MSTLDSLSVEAYAIAAVGAVVAIVAVAVVYTLRQVSDLRLRMRFHRPRYIILVRHAESEGNVDVRSYGSVGDPNISLTVKGREQAKEAGEKLKELLGDTPVFCYYSPYRRSRQTAQIILPYLETRFQKEDVRLREREFAGSFQRNEVNRKDERTYSRFFWRPDGGESLADVYDRVTLFMENLWRDFKGHPDMNESAILLVSHGLT